MSDSTEAYEPSRTTNGYIFENVRKYKGHVFVREPVDRIDFTEPPPLTESRRVVATEEALRDLKKFLSQLLVDVHEESFTALILRSRAYQKRKAMESLNPGSPDFRKLSREVEDDFREAEAKSIDAQKRLSSIIAKSAEESRKAALESARASKRMSVWAFIVGGATLLNFLNRRFRVPVIWLACWVSLRLPFCLLIPSS